MANTPKYVRLATRLNRTIVADVGGSGWGITGLDVKAFPSAEDEPVAYEFVRQAFREGKLEEADEASFNAVQYANERISAAGYYDEDEGETVNEAAIQAEVRKAFKDLLSDTQKPEPEVPAEEPGEDPEPAELDSLSRDELVEYAKEIHGLELNKSVSKADALAAIAAAEANA